MSAHLNGVPVMLHPPRDRWIILYTRDGRTRAHVQYCEIARHVWHVRELNPYVFIALDAATDMLIDRAGHQCSADITARLFSEYPDAQPVTAPTDPHTQRRGRRRPVSRDRGLFPETPAKRHPRRSDYD